MYKGIIIIKIINIHARFFFCGADYNSRLRKYVGQVEMLDGRILREDIDNIEQRIFLSSL